MSPLDGQQVTQAIRLMLVKPGGCEHSTAEFATLFSAAGLRFVGATISSSGWHVFEGVAE